MMSLLCCVRWTSSARSNSSPRMTSPPVAFANCSELSAIATAISAAKVAQVTVARPCKLEGKTRASASGSIQQFLNAENLASASCVLVILMQNRCWLSLAIYRVIQFLQLKFSQWVCQQPWEIVSLLLWSDQILHIFRWVAVGCLFMQKQMQRIY